VSKKELKFVIVTGMSGAGKSLTINCLEDIGYFCVDNIPTELLPKFSELFLYSKGKIKKIAIVVDVRDSSFKDNIDSALKELDSTEKAYKIVGKIMLAASKDDLSKDLKEKKDVAAVRLKNFSKQEETLQKSIEELQKEVMAELQKD